LKARSGTVAAVLLALAALLAIPAGPSRAVVPAENLLPLGPPTPGGRNAGCQFLSPSEARRSLGRSTVIGQYDSGNLIICNLGLGMEKMITIGVFDRGAQSRLGWKGIKQALRQNRAAGMLVAPLRGLGDAAWKEVHGTQGMRQVSVRIGERAFRVTVLTNSAAIPQLIRVARFVTARLR
jgi:hypothetical protein